MGRYVCPLGKNMSQYILLTLIIVALTWRLIRESRTNLGLSLRQAIAVGLFRATSYIVISAVMALIAFWIVALLPSPRWADRLVPWIAGLAGMYVAILLDRRVRTAIDNKAKNT